MPRPKKPTPPNDPTASLAARILKSISRTDPPASALEQARKFLKASRLHAVPERARIEAKLDAQLRKAMDDLDAPACVLDTHRKFHAERAAMRQPSGQQAPVLDADRLAYIGQCILDSGITELPFEADGTPNPRFIPN